MSFPRRTGEDHQAVLHRAFRHNNKRRSQDHFWDFLMYDSASPPQWLQHAVNIVRTDLPDFLRDKYEPVLQKLESPPWHELHYAFWFTCLTMYSAMVRFLVFDPTIERANQKLLGIFLKQKLPKLVDNWLAGRYSSTQSFVRHVRSEYAFDVPCLALMD